MTTLPVRFDVFALVMLLGVVQAVLLALFFLTGARRAHPANRYLGWLLLGLAALATDVLLGYTNYMFRLLALVDCTEPINLLLAPFYYAYVVSRLTHRPPPRFSWHLLPALSWAVYALTWLTQSRAFQYNAYISAFHPDLPFVAHAARWPTAIYGLREWFDLITVASLLLYNTLALRAVWRAFRRGGLPFWSAAPAPLPSLRFLSLLQLALPVLVVTTKRLFPGDLGDYIIICYATVITYSTTFWVLVGRVVADAPDTTDSLTTNPPTPGPEDHEPKKKYEKSALSDEVEEALLNRLTQLTNAEKPYMTADVSLPALARRLNTSPHHLSQVLNNRLGLSFFDWLAQHRVAEAQRLLTDPATARLKVDEIAERVGYNSTSAFHTAFKRLTNQTPAQFRDGVARQERA